MLGINTNINSLVSQQNLTGSGSALSQAITRLSSGKRINSAADDAAGLAISNIMQTQINGLNQGVSNSNDGTSMVQTASSGLASLTSSLQRIRQLATQAANGSMTDDDRAALQKEVSQQISEVNRIASQTTYNGMNLLDGSMGSVTFQVGANVGQAITLNLSQDMSAAKLGTGVPQAGNTLGSFTNLSLDSTGALSSDGGSTSAGAGAAVITTINVISDGSGGFTLTDQNNQAIKYADVSAGFSSAGVSSDSAGNAVIDSSAASAGSAGSNFAAAIDTAMAGASSGVGFSSASEVAVGSQIDYLNSTSKVSDIDISTASGASMAMESIDNALTTLNNLQATLGAAQNRFSAIGSTQQAQSTDLASAQSSIQDADFAQETANLSKAQVLQQAGISVLAQANSQPQQILKLLQ
ncbi:flagellin [Paraburkholderia sp. Ac-20347]|uniref:flagellin n=1 Tax=Paraburkholderia sp. Ac-20347 TaxID=2703892 RepID=UPI0019808DD8|nr:flagellin [Paraburkholderia sp. Ac-20347]MBN3810751.1 flagellin [Paraburkholderia sp. Ac-20347]